MTAFEALYQRYARDIFRFSLYLCGNREEAEDITSDTFVRAWTTAEIVETSAKAYLLRIARNRYLEGLRRRRPHVEIDANLADSASGPFHAVEQQSDVKQVLRLLQQIPETDRVALLLHAQQEWPYQEIAAALGLSLAAVKVKIHRARLKLAQLRAEETTR